MKRIIIAVIAAITIVTIIGYIKIKRNEPQKTSQAVSALPSDIAFFIQTNDVSEFLNQIGQKNIISSKILNAQTNSLVQNYYTSIKKLFLAFPKLEDLLNDHTTLIAFRRQGKYDIDILFVIETKTSADQKKFNREIAHIVKKLNLKIEPTEYNKIKIYIINSKEQKIYLTFVNGLLLISRSELLLQNSIRQIINKVSLDSDPEFTRISNLYGKQAIATIYINYANLWTILYPHLSVLGTNILDNLKDFADWSGLDINLDHDVIRFYGYTTAEQTPKKYLHIFHNIDGEKFVVDKILPNKTQEYIIFSYDDFKTFITHYNEYLIAKNLDVVYSNKAKEFKTRYKFNPRLEFIDKIGTSIAVVKVKYDLSSNKEDKYLIIRLKNRQAVAKFLNQYISIYAEKKHSDVRKFSHKYNAGGGVIVIQQLPSEHFFDMIFGELYKLPPHKYYFYLDDYIIMGRDREAIKKFADAYFGNHTLGKNKEYNEFRKNLTPKSAITYYIKRPFVSGKVNKFINVKTQNLIRNKLDILFDINNFALQFYPQKDNTFLTYLYLNYKKGSISVSSNIWQRKLLASIDTKPFIFINHYTKEKEIFVADVKGNIYLIDRKGEILWTRKLNEPIFGEIYMVDYYQNGKYQLAFNTKSKIYIIDRKGRDVENFPITLPAKASASISIFDYEHDGNYRIFAPCENNKVYLYTKKGQLNPGWFITNTSAPVRQPLQHFVYKGRDYIIFADDIHTYILNRRGEVRIPVKQTFHKAVNTKFYFIGIDSLHHNAGFITTAKDGKIVFINLTGKMQISSVPNNFTEKHYFIFTDWNGDGRYEYIYIDNNKLYVYNEQLKPMFSNAIEFKGKILQTPNLYTFSKTDRRVGFLTSEKLIYMVNNQGEFSKGFPKQGSTRFTITSLQAKGLNLLVGNNQFLVNYKF